MRLPVVRSGVAEPRIDGAVQCTTLVYAQGWNRPVLLSLRTDQFLDGTVGVGIWRGQVARHLLPLFVQMLAGT